MEVCQSCYYIFLNPTAFDTDNCICKLIFNSSVNKKVDLSTPYSYAVLVLYKYIDPRYVAKGTSLMFVDTIFNNTDIHNDYYIVTTNSETVMSRKL